MSEEELEGKQPEGGPVEDKPLEGSAPQGAIYDGPIEKFKGKTAAEIAQAYAEVESFAKKKDSEIAAHREKLQAYEQWYRNMQSQGQNPQYNPPRQPEQPPDIYDNPQAFVQYAAQPLVSRAVEEANYRSAINIAPIVENQAKSMYPDVFDGVDEGSLRNIMYSGVKTGAIHYSALTDPNAWKMAAWQMKGDSTGYKPASPKPMNPTQTERPGSGPGEDEPRAMDAEARAMAAALGKDPKRAQELWEAREKARRAKK